MRLSGTGIWSAGIRSGDPGAVAEAVAELDEMGYTSLWIPSYGAGTFESIEVLLSATRRMTVATGILSVWVISPEDAATSTQRLRAAHGDRFLLGLGVSHASIVEALVENARYENPLRAMETFLDGLDHASSPVHSDVRVLAALGPKMLELARRRAGGALPYNVTPEHTARARAVLGPSKLLVTEQAVTLATSAEDGRRIGRGFVEHYLALPNYANNLRRLGFTDDDFTDGGSDRLIDALIAWGDEDAIASRVQAHRDAGADSICIQVISSGALGGMVDLHRQTWRTLAPALTVL